MSAFLTGLGALSGPVASAASGGPALSGSGDASSGGNLIIPPNSGLNVGAIINALGGQRESGGLPIQMPNGLGTGFGSTQKVAAQVSGLGSSVGVSISPLILIGGAGLAAFLFFRNR